MLNKIFRFIDTISRSQKWTSVVISMLMLITVYTVMARYIWNKPPIWGIDVQTYMLSFILLFSVSYTLVQGGHVRVDLLTNKFLSQRGQDITIVLGYLIFFMPFTLVLLIKGTDFFMESLAVRETIMSPWRPIAYPIKAFIPIAALMLLLQGLVEMIRHLIYAIKGRDNEC